LCIASSSAENLPLIVALALPAMVLGVLWWMERRRRCGLAVELKKAEARAELAEAVFNACPEGILMMDPHHPDEPLAIVACNDHACELHQRTREELVGRSVNQIEERPDWWRDRAAVQVLLDDIKKSKVKRGEARHRKKDGVLFPLEYSNSLITVSGREYVLGFDRDITARKEAERELRASEERFRLIIDASPVPIQLLDPHDAEKPMRIVAANRRAAEMHGVSLEQFIGRSMGDFEPKPVTIEEAQAKVAVLRTCTHIDGEGMHRHVDGHEFPIEFTCALVMIGGRELIIGCDHDVGERKRLDAEVAESRRLRAVGAMVGGVAHEFNNLLTPILLHLEQSKDPEAVPVLRAVEQARELTRRILTFGRKPEGIEVCDASTALRECVELMGKTIDRRIELIFDATEECLVQIARNDLSQIFINLLFNARDTLIEKIEQGVPAGWVPQIRMEVSALKSDRYGAHGAWVLIRVIDNGLGISPAVKERVFEPFFTTKPPGKGTGLGLATVWHLVRAAGGQVDFRSTEGLGSTVDIYMPAGSVPVASLATGRTTPSTSAPPFVTKGNVMLVEDNEHISAVMLPMLGAGGYTVTHMGNGAEACAALIAEPLRWDRVLTDLNLPGMHGLELVRRIRKSGYRGKIVVYSGMIEPGDAVLLKEAGVSAILEKPFAMNVLWEALR
jgi:PAS domain S-box-containing protein